MQPRKQVGVRVDDLRMDVKRGLRWAAKLKFSTVEVSADGEETTAEALSESGRRHLARLVAGHGLGFASLACDSRGGGLADAAQTDVIVTRAGRTLQLAADMGVPVVSHEVGDLLSLSEDERARVIEALRALADQAERVGTVYAVRSRLCTPDALRGLIGTVDCPLVKVAVDPGALLMAGFDPLEVLAAHGDQVVLAYVRDALRGTPEQAGQETALGEGQLDLDAYLAGLSGCGCGRPPILRRAQTTDAAGQLAADKAFLESHVLT